MKDSQKKEPKMTTNSAAPDAVVASNLFCKGCKKRFEATKADVDKAREASGYTLEDGTDEEIANDFIICRPCSEM